MALRVLLADESTTIKKVMQLALQDFAVEVKAVHVGVDVVEVARTFQPDIIFADVLLQKKNGYDVCSDLKNDSGLKATPVVLMWSSFMDLDEKQAAQCGAENRLEKPFDVESLRQLVLELVPKTRSQRLAHFLKFPDSFTGPMKTEAQTQKEAAQSTATLTAPQSSPVAPAEAKTSPRPESRPAVGAKTPPPSARTPIPPPAAPTSAPAATSAPKSTPAAPSGAPRAIPMPPPAKPAPAAPSVSDLASEAKSAWNMDSFDDISTFAEEEPAALDSFSADDSGDEGFAEFKLTNLTASRKNPLETPAPRANAEATDDDDPWSHQDLSAFKIDLPPVSVEGEEFGLTFDLSGKDPEGTGFLLNRHMNSTSTEKEAETDPETSHGSAHGTAAMQLENDSMDMGPTHGPSKDDEGIEELEMPEHYQAYQPLEEEPMDSGPEISLDAEEEQFTRSRMPQFQLSDMTTESEQPMHLDPIMTSFETEGPDLVEAATARAAVKPSHPPKTPSAPSTNAGATKIPQLNADQLEEIIRSQSREIIESVVRRIVPDLASDIIKQELQRLLEETAIRETPGRETRR